MEEPAPKSVNVATRMWPGGMLTCACCSAEALLSCEEVPQLLSPLDGELGMWADEAARVMREQLAGPRRGERGRRRGPIGRPRGSKNPPKDPALAAAQPTTITPNSSIVGKKKLGRPRY